MKSLLIILSVFVAQFGFAKSIDDEAKERIEIVNKATYDRAIAVNDYFTDLAAIVANKLTSAGVIAVEAVLIEKPYIKKSEETIYSDVKQVAYYAVSLASGDVCSITLSNSAEAFSQQRAVQIRGEVFPKNVTCVGPLGETVVETENSYSYGTITSVTGQEMQTNDAIADYTFVTFNILL